MRVLMVSNLFRPVELGGYERGCAELADELAAEGHEVFVLTTDLTAAGPGDDAQPDGVVVFRELRSYRRLDGTFENGSLRWRIGVERWNLSVLRNRLQVLAPDVVMWWNLGGLNATLVEAARRAGVPACGVVNDYWMRWVDLVDPWARLRARVPGLGALADLTLGLPRRVDYAGAAHWVFVSDHVRRRAIDKVGPLPRTSIVHSGIDLETFTWRGDEPTWARRLLFVGRVTENKGIDIAIDALEQLDGATLTVCGPRDASVGADLERDLERRGLRERVRFEDQRGPAELADEYAAHDAVVFPVRWEEPWGKVPLEAMAVGVPVITSATGGSADYCRDGENCLVARDPAAVAAAVGQLEQSPELRARLAGEGRATAGRFGTGQANDGRRQIVEAIAAAGH